MNQMANLLGKVPGFGTAIQFARIAIILVSSVTAVFMAVRLGAPYFLELVSSSLPAVWIAVQLIIVVVWKLSVKPPETPPPPPPPIKEKNLRSQPTIPVDRNPSSSEFWPEIPHPVAPEPGSKSPISVPNSGQLPPEETFEIKKSLNPPSPERLRPSEEADGDDSIEATWKAMPSPERLRTSEEADEDDSMEAAWKAIMDGGATPVRRPLSKSGTWEGSPRVEALARAAAAGRPEMRKSKTFREAAPAVGLRGRKAAAVGRGDELLGRAEEFIKMHYEHLRMQRQESEQRRFMEVVNHAY